MLRFYTEVACDELRRHGQSITPGSVHNYIRHIHGNFLFFLCCSAFNNYKKFSNQLRGRPEGMQREKLRLFRLPVLPLPHAAPHL